MGTPEPVDFRKDSDDAQTSELTTLSSSVQHDRYEDSLQQTLKKTARKEERATTITLEDDPFTRITPLKKKQKALMTPQIPQKKKPMKQFPKSAPTKGASEL